MRGNLTQDHNLIHPLHIFHGLYKFADLLRVNVSIDMLKRLYLEKCRLADRDWRYNRPTLLYWMLGGEGISGRVK